MAKKIRKTLTLFLLVWAAFMVITGTAAAQDSTEDLMKTASDIVAFIRNVATALLVVLELIAGLMFMTAGGDSERVMSAKALAKNAALGYFLIIAANVIYLLFEEIGFTPQPIIPWS